MLSPNRFPPLLPRPLPPLPRPLPRPLLSELSKGENQGVGSAVRREGGGRDDLICCCGCCWPSPSSVGLMSVVRMAKRRRDILIKAINWRTVTGSECLLMPSISSDLEGEGGTSEEESSEGGDKGDSKEGAPEDPTKYLSARTDMRRGEGRERTPEGRRKPLKTSAETMTLWRGRKGWVPGK